MGKLSIETLVIGILHKNTTNFYRGFHITFDERVPKFVRNFRSWWRTWQLDYVVANQVGNFAAKFEITTRTSQPQFGTKFAEAWGIIINPFTRQRKALPNNVREKIEDDYWHKKSNRKRAETRQTVSSIVDNFVRKGHVEAGKGGNKIRYARTDDVINY